MTEASKNGKEAAFQKLIQTILTSVEKPEMHGDENSPFCHLFDDNNSVGRGLR